MQIFLTSSSNNFVVASCITAALNASIKIDQNSVEAFCSKQARKFWFPKALLEVMPNVLSHYEVQNIVCSFNKDVKLLASKIQAEYCFSKIKSLDYTLRLSDFASPVLFHVKNGSPLRNWKQTGRRGSLVQENTPPDFLNPRTHFLSLEYWLPRGAPVGYFSVKLLLAPVSRVSRAFADFSHQNIQSTLWDKTDNLYKVLFNTNWAFHIKTVVTYTGTGLLWWNNQSIVVARLD